jgi:PAS domain-containing protein
MHFDQWSTRHWMQALARIRAKAARLRTSVKPEQEEALAILDEALEFADRMRAGCAAIQQRNSQLEARLRQHDAEVHELIDTLPPALICTDVAGLIVDVNRAGAALLGLSQARLKNELLLYFAEDRAGFGDFVRTLPRSSGVAARASARIRPRDRAPFVAEMTVIRDPREGDDQWIWTFERVSGARMRGRTRSPGAAAPSPSDPCVT